MGRGRPLFPSEKCACHVSKLPMEMPTASGRSPLVDHRNAAVSAISALEFITSADLARSGDDARVAGGPLVGVPATLIDTGGRQIAVFRTGQEGSYQLRASTAGTTCWPPPPVGTTRPRSSSPSWTARCSGRSCSRASTPSTPRIPEKPYTNSAAAVATTTGSRAATWMLIALSVPRVCWGLGGVCQAG
jgi:hypothetical protein